MAGLLAFFIGIVILFICLAGLVWVLQRSLLTASTRIIHKATDINGYVAMTIGAGLTVAVQSSSITTSTLTPLVGLDVLQLEQMFPLTLGANIGTTMTSIMSALVTEGTDALQVALAHLMFNITGIVIWYPIPYLRAVPLALARRLGKATRHWKGFPILYIIIMFLVLPALFLGISSLFQEKETGTTVVGVIVLIAVVGGIGKFVYWWNYQGGDAYTVSLLVTRQKRLDAKETLAYDMFWMKRKLNELHEHTGCQPASVKRSTIGSNESALMDIHIDMPLALRNTKKLIIHSDLPQGKEESPIVEGGEPDRFAQKKSEEDKMEGVDFDEWNRRHLWVLALYAACLAGILVFVGLMFAKDSVASSGAAGFILALTLVFVAWRAYEFFFNNGSGRSKEIYTHKRRREHAFETYGADIAEVKYSIVVLADHLKIRIEEPGTDDEGDEALGKKLAADNGDDEEEA